MSRQDAQPHIRRHFGFTALVLCSLMMSCCWLQTTAMAGDESSKYFYYSTVDDLDNPKAPPATHALTLSTEKIGVIFQEGLSDTQQGEVLAAYTQVGDVAKEGEWRMIRHTRPILVVPLRDVKASDEVEVLLEALNSDSSIALATPVFQAVAGFDELLTDEFFASFPAKTPKEKIDELNSQYGVEVVYTRDYSIIGKIGYRLRVTCESGMNALDMANLYYEHPLTVRATPSFISLYPIIDMTPNDANFTSQWNLTQMHAPPAWDIDTGSSAVTIAVVDTGVDVDHEDLVSKLLRDAANNIVGRNFTVDPPDSNFDDDDTYTTAGHGTMCASTAAAETNNSIGIAGVSWGARIMPVKTIVGSTGEGDDEDIINGIHWAADNGADIISLSLSGPDDTDEKRLACEYARALGCVLVASSGNYDLPADRYPAMYPEVICVGAADSDDRRWYMMPFTGSCWGYHLDVMAPAESSGIVAAARNGGYTTIFGMTSAACPQVAGLVALVLSLDPTLTPSEIQAIIEFSADDLEYTRLFPYEAAGEGRDVLTGYGRINCEQALELAATKRLVLRNNNGVHLASFDEEGNFTLEGNGLGQDSVDSEVLTEAELTQELIPSAALNEFLVQDGNGTILARLTADEDPLWDADSDGDRDDDNDGLVDEMMFIRGRLYENVGIDLDTAVTVPSFRIKNGEGDTVALINSESFTNANVEPDFSNCILAGSLLLKGRAFISVNPDRRGSIGE